MSGNLLFAELIAFSDDFYGYVLGIPLGEGEKPYPTLRRLTQRR